MLLGYGPEPITLPTQPMILNRLHVAANPSGSPHDLRGTLAFSAAHDMLPDVTAITLDQAALGPADCRFAGPPCRQLEGTASRRGAASRVLRGTEVSPAVAAGTVAPSVRALRTAM